MINIAVLSPSDIQWRDWAEAQSNLRSHDRYHAAGDNWKATRIVNGMTFMRLSFDAIVLLRGYREIPHWKKLLKAIDAFWRVP